MGSLSSGLRDAFEGQGDAGFFAWTYASFDRLEEILRPGYFNSAHRLAPGDLVYVGTRPRPATSPWSKGQASTEIHRALLMVKGRDADGLMRVRLVQDYGRPDDPEAPLAAAKRGRGRPAKATAE